MSIYTVRVSIDTSSFRRSAAGSITGIVFLECDEFGFPEKNWTDFVAVVLLWWSQELPSFLKGQTKTARLRFMDGPFWVRLSNLRGNHVTIECVDGRRNESVEHSVTGDVRDLVATLKSAAIATVEFCDAAGWESSDLEELATLAKRQD